MPDNRGILREDNTDEQNQKMDGLYKDIYTSRPDNRRNINDIIDGLDTAIDRLHGTDIGATGMTELLRRVDNNQNSNSRKLLSSVSDLFSDNNLISGMFSNDEIHKYIAGQNYNYDLICKYLPKLQAALDIKRDNVLCSDSFDKNFINPKAIRSAKEAHQKFVANTKKLEQEYELTDFFEETYDRTSKYGEDFLYIVPYPVAFKRLIKRSQQRALSARVGRVTVFEGYEEEVLLKKDYNAGKEFSLFLENVKDQYAPDEVKEVMDNFPALGQLNIHYNHSNMVNGAINEYTILSEKADLEQLQSLSSIYESAFIENMRFEAKESNQFRTAPDDELLDEANEKFNNMFKAVQKQQVKLTNSTTADGLIVPGNLLRNADEIDNNISGAVLERLPRENVLPIYIGKKCLGYYYFEFAEDPNACGFCGGHHMTPGISNGTKLAYDMTQNQQELAIRFIASRLSGAIDTKFINANKDLKEEIYAILQYNDKFDISRTNNIGVTFIPAEDIIHCYNKLDQVTHRGISDLKDAVVPAMLYILLYLTDLINKITMSTDKRVYYVKQNVEQNVARTMMNVVAQIKKGNMGMRQIESMNNILNIVGRFNNYVIPLGPSGDPPVQFDVIQGMNQDSPTDLMDKMEDMAVNTIMPMEFVNSTLQQDFATRFTMSNTRFMRSIFTRQRKTERWMSKAYTKLYNYEFKENNSYIQVILPPPTYLVVTNNSQMMDSVSQMADKIVDIYLNNYEEEVKKEFKKQYIIELLGTYMDHDAIERLIDLAKINIETSKDPKVEDGENSDLGEEEDEEF